MEDKIEVSTTNQDSNADLVGSNESTPNGVVFDFLEVKQLIDDHFNKIKGLVRYTKEKDANVLALSKQMQVYRDGFESSLLKRVALEVIEYRENCRKSLRSVAASELNAQESQKYISYLKLDFEDMLENLGIKCTDDVVLYNGKNIESSLEKLSFKDVPQLEDVELGNLEIVDMNSLIEYLKSCQDALSKMIQNNTIAVDDSVLKIDDTIVKTFTTVGNDRNFNLAFVHKDSVVSAYKEGYTCHLEVYGPVITGVRVKDISTTSEIKELYVNGENITLKELGGGFTFRLKSADGE